MKLIGIGFGNLISAERIIAIVSPESAPIKRMIQDARERGLLIDKDRRRLKRLISVRNVAKKAVNSESVSNKNP
ncbi:MAG: DUF370 domain-containing protein [Thermoguttaceae bacterium]|nr:DUF370 domain-containing protein [Thermoguttaceae bacterium]